jgi:tRNA threonylcarbamoyladenosine biosynthesis protein TsaB
MTTLKFLAFDTSTDMMSVALSDGTQTWGHHGIGVANASAQLIPVIQNLLSQAMLQLSDLTALVIGQGPGSFTGLRTACAVAQGLALGAHLKVIAVDTLMAVAEDARTQLAASARIGQQSFQVGVIMDARMSEVYAGAYEWHAHAQQWQSMIPLQVSSPEVAVQTLCEHMGRHLVLAGNGLEVYKDRVNLDSLSTLKGSATGFETAAKTEVICISAMPHAKALLQLAPALWQKGLAVEPEQVQPIYIRNKVAQTTVERELIKAEKAEQALLAQVDNKGCESP